MSTEPTGDAAFVQNAVEQAKGLIDQRVADEQQLDLLSDPVTPEEMAEARETVGPHAGRLSVLRAAREKKRGRPPGARNKRTDDFARYILGFGQHPALTMMQIQAAAPEVLIENSRRTVTKVLKGPKDAGDRLVNVVEDTLTYEGAQSLRIRCAEGLLPYLESKKPVAVDMSFSNLTDMFIEGVTHTRDEIDDILDAEYLPLDEDEGGAA